MAAIIGNAGFWGVAMRNRVFRRGKKGCALTVSELEDALKALSSAMYNPPQQRKRKGVGRIRNAHRFSAPLPHYEW